MASLIIGRSQLQPFCSLQLEEAIEMKGKMNHSLLLVCLTVERALAAPNMALESLGLSG